MVPLGQAFGSLVGPQNWKPLARARPPLVATLPQWRNLFTKHQTLISKVEFSPPPESAITFTPAVTDSL